MKTKLLKNTLIAVTFLFSFAAIAQIDLTFDTDGDAEGFAVAGPGGPTLSVSGGLLTANATGVNLQLRRNGTNVGATGEFKTILLDIKNASNADRLVVQVVSGGTTSVFTQTLSTADSAEQSYQMDIDNAAWVGTFQLRFRFVVSGGADIDGANVEINRVQIVDPATLGTEEFVANDFLIYPNPASEFINIKSLEGANIEIYNIVGKMVKSEVSQSNDHAMNVSNLNSGIYLLKLTSEDKSATKKLIIE